MKRWCIVLTALFLLSLLAGCHSSAPDTPGSDVTTQTTADTSPGVSRINPDSVEVTVPKEGLTGETGESDIAIGATGGIRITYSGNISSVRYVTSREQLPDYPELQGYDDAYFQEHGLLLVMETVTSGGVEVGIEGISLEGDCAAVRLSHESQGDMGTAVMTTWLLWAEVAGGLDCVWEVENPAVESDTQRY